MLWFLSLVTGFVFYNCLFFWKNFPIFKKLHIVILEVVVQVIISKHKNVQSNNDSANYSGKWRKTVVQLYLFFVKNTQKRSLFKTLHSVKEGIVNLSQKIHLTLILLQCLNTGFQQTIQFNGTLIKKFSIKNSFCPSQYYCYGTYLVLIVSCVLGSSTYISMDIDRYSMDRHIGIDYDMNINVLIYK